MAKTRAKKGTTQQNKEPSTTPQLQQLEPSVSNPPKLFILPKDTSAEARIVTLPNPATGSPNRYFVCPDKGFYEFTRIAAPRRGCRSWLLAPEQAGGDGEQAGEGGEGGVAGNEDGYVLQTAEMMVATPIDPLFLLLPVLVQEGKNMFFEAGGYVDLLGEKSAHFKELVRLDRQSGGRLEKLLETRMMVVCDEMEAGEERLYKLSQDKLCGVLREKAERMVARGLPPSMEERFVKQPLVVPMMSVKREASIMSIAINDELEDMESGASQTETSSAQESQDTQTSSITATSVSTAATSVAATPSDEVSTTDKEIQHLLRLRTALNYLLNSYIPTSSRKILSPVLTSSADFTPLSTHLEHLTKRKAEAQALRTMSENISRKRGLEDDDEPLEKAEMKKRKKEEEEFRRKNMSRGVQQLKNADTTGMKKMSSFFAKAPAVGKK